MKNLNPAQKQNVLNSIAQKLPYYNYLLNIATEEINNFSNKKHKSDLLRKIYEHHVNSTYYLATSKINKLTFEKNQYEN